MFTGTLGENSSVPFWCANRAKFINDLDAPKLIKTTYEWYKAVQAPVFMETRTTPGFGYVIMVSLRAKTSKVLMQRLRNIFASADPATVKQLRETCPIRKLILTNVDDVKAPDHRYDPCNRTRNSNPIREGKQPNEPNHYAAVERTPQDDLKDEAVAQAVRRRPSTHVWLVNGHRARLATEIEMHFRLRELGFRIATRNNIDFFYMSPDGKFFRTIHGVSCYVYAPRFIAGGLYVIQSFHTMKPRTDDILFLPPAEQATIASTITHATREYADVRGVCCICGSDSDQDQMIWCSAPSLDTPGLKGRELCGRGVHFHCLNYNLRFNIRDLRRLRNSCFCSRDCQFRGTHLKLRGITNVDKPDIVFGLVAEPKPWMHVFSVATTVLAQKMTSAQLRQITQDRLAAGLAIDNVRAALEEKSVASSVSTPPEERKKKNKGYHTRFETGYTLKAGQIKETRRSTEEAAGNTKVSAKASLAPSTLTHATGETDAAVPLGLPHAPYPSDIFLPPNDDECEGDDMADASTVTREVYNDLLTQLKEDAAMCVDIVPVVAKDERPAPGVRDATIESDALAVSAVEESSVRLVDERAPATTGRPAGASPVDGAAARAMDVSAPVLHPAECKSTTPNRCLRAAVLSADDAVAATGSDAVPSHDHPLISNDACVDVTGFESTKRLQPDEPADSSDDDVERRPARRAVHFADTVDGDALASTSQPLVAPSSDASGSDDDSDKNDGRDGAVEHDDDDGDEEYVEEEACEAKTTADGPTPAHVPADEAAGWDTCESDVEEVEPKCRAAPRAWTDDEHERFVDAVNRFGKQWKRVAAAVGRERRSSAESTSDSTLRASRLTTRRRRTSPSTPLSACTKPNTSKLSSGSYTGARK